MGIEIIAELAQGFEGRPGQAHLLLNAAAAAGADAAKYQLVYADELATPEYTYYDLFRSLEMPDSVWHELNANARELGIRLQFDIFGERSLTLADAIGVTAVKLHGTDIANVGLLRAVAKSSIQRVLLGCGGAHASEIDGAITMLEGKEVTILFGFQGYPTPNDCNQIDRVRLISDRYRRHPHIRVGFADHAPPESPLRFALSAMAVGAGARSIEKHLTLGKVMKLEDHEAALNPDEFAEFIDVIRDCEQALGEAANTENFAMSESEQSYRRQIRRHVVSARDLSAGTLIGPEDLVLKRSANSEALNDLSLAYGATLQSDLPVNSPLTPTEIK